MQPPHADILVSNFHALDLHLGPPGPDPLANPGGR